MTIRNLEYALRPSSIAVIGASDDGGSVGEKLTENILGGGFAGPVYLVNPKRRRIAGQDGFQSIDELPEAPDLAVIATPPDTVPGLIAALGKKGTRAAVVITAGLGLELRQRMLDAARPTCLRIIGPNCLGIWVPALGVNANFGKLPIWTPSPTRSCGCRSSWWIARPCLSSTSTRCSPTRPA